MSAPPTAAPAPGPPSGGLGRVLARAALPPVAVPSAYSEPRAVRQAVPSGAVPDRTSKGRPSVRPAAPWAVPTEPGWPAVDATDEAATAEVVALGDPSSGPTTAVVPRRGVPTAILDDQERPVAPAEAGPTPTTPVPRSGAPQWAQARPSGAPGAVAHADEPGVESGIQSVRPPTVAVQAGVDPASSQLPADSVVVTQDSTRTAIAPPESPATWISPPAAERPDGTIAPAPPVVIGRIEVHVDSPATEQDPFAGCRVVAGGLTARRGGAW